MIWNSVLRHQHSKTLELTYAPKKEDEDEQGGGEQFKTLVNDKHALNLIE